MYRIILFFIIVIYPLNKLNNVNALSVSFS